MRVVLLQALGLGDLLTALPAVRAIRNRFSDAELIWAGNPEYADLITSEVDTIIPITDLNSWTQLPKADVGVNLHGKGPRSHEFLAYSDRLIAFFHSTLAPDGPAWSERTHVRQLWIDLLASYHIEGDSSDFYLQSTSGSGDHIVLHLGAKHRDRWWPLDRFIEVRQALPNVVITAGPAERQRALEMGVEPSAGSLGDLLAIIQSARLVISADSGVAHLAYAYRRPSVTLFGPAPAARWGPPDDAQHKILGNRNVYEAIRPEGPCSPYLMAVTAADVIAAAEELLDAL